MKFNFKGYYIEDGEYLAGAIKELKKRLGNIENDIDSFVKGTSKNHFLYAVAHDGSPETIVFRPIGSKRLVRVFRGALKKIETTDDLGTHLGKGIYRARLKNSNKGLGKSGGYRLVTLLRVVENKIFLVYIYDKSDYESLSDSDLLELIESLAQRPRF